MAPAAVIAARCMGGLLAVSGNAQSPFYRLSTDARPSASLCVPNEAGRSGDEVKSCQHIITGTVGNKRA